MAGDEVEIAPVRPGVCFGRCGSVLLLAYREPPTVADLRLREELLERMAASSSQGAFLSVIDASGATPLPDSESRAESARQLARYASYVRAGAVVVRGRGVRVSLLRSLLRGMMIVKSSPFATRFFEDVPAAARFCLEALGERDAAAVRELVRAAEEVERASR